MVHINIQWCKGCGICVAFCPKKALSLDEMTQKAQWEGDPSDPDRPGWSSYPDNAHVIVTVK